MIRILIDSVMGITHNLLSLPDTMFATCIVLLGMLRTSSTSDTETMLSDLRLKQRLIITTVEVEPYYMRVSNHSREFEGYIPDLVAELARRMNFEYYLRSSRDGEYGQKRPDGSWTGMIGELLTGAADIAAAPLFVTEQREQVVEFSDPYMHVKGTILLRRPLLGTKPYVSSARQLIRQSEIKYGTLDTGMILWSFRNTNDTVNRIMWRKMQRFEPSTLTESNEHGIERVRHEKYAYVLPSTIGEYVAEREPCDLITVDRFLMDRGYALAAKKDTHLMRAFSDALRKLKRDGFLRDIYDKWWFQRSDCRNGVLSSKLYSASGCSRTRFALVLTVLVTICSFSV